MGSMMRHHPQVRADRGGWVGGWLAEGSEGEQLWSIVFVSYGECPPDVVAFLHVFNPRVRILESMILV